LTFKENCIVLLYGLGYLLLILSELTAIEYVKAILLFVLAKLSMTGVTETLDILTN
jgi:hypothetical protein